MVGPTAQLVALTCHLNARMRGFPPQRFFPDNSTCQFCEFVRFVRKERVRRWWFTQRDEWRLVAPTPDEWLASMVDAGCTRAVLLHGAVNQPGISDRMSAGMIGGGGRWRLQVQRDGCVEDWDAGWRVGNRDAADRRIWQVQYEAAADEPIAEPTAISLDELSKEIRDALRQIEQFAREKNLDNFGDCFARGQECLAAEDPFSIVHHRDLAPEGFLRPPAARLLAACQAAWVFGGMGSWNDLGFDGEDEQRYETLSERVFNLLNQAICAAVNDSAVDVREQ